MVDLVLNLTDFCNHKCKFCELQAERKNRNILPFDVVKKFIGDTPTVSTIDTKGLGDFTTHPEFVTFMNYFRDKNFGICMLTNGALLNDEKIEAIANANVYLLNISLNSLNRETYKHLMGVDNLPHVLENIDKLIKVYERINKRPNLTFSFVMTPYNLNEIYDFIHFGERYHFGIICRGLEPTCQPFYTNDLLIDENEKQLTEYEKYRIYASQRNVSFSINTRNLCNENSYRKDISSCKDIYTTMIIYSDGNIYPCCHSKRSMGNIYQQTFDSVWYGQMYTELRELTKKGDDRYCKDCCRYLISY